MRLKFVYAGGVRYRLGFLELGGYVLGLCFVVRYFEFLVVLFLE